MLLFNYNSYFVTMEKNLDEYPNHNSQENSYNEIDQCINTLKSLIGDLMNITSPSHISLVNSLDTIITSIVHAQMQFLISCI